MASRGAEGSAQELAAIVSYLAEFFGRVNVNAASAAELETSLGIAGKEAQAIVEYRGAHGEFKNLDQLKQTPGVNADKLQEKRDLIAFKE
jgi:competence protein ComEA